MLTLKISVDNLIYNACVLRQNTSAEICAVVKANAYGHGARIAEFLDGYVDAFAVSCAEEALEIRKFTSKPIYVLCPSYDIEDSNVIYSAMGKKDLLHKRICVKINTGMNRLGILPSEYEDFLTLAKSYGAQIDSIYTHFSSTDYAEVQRQRFESVKTQLKRHAAASNFLSLDKKYHYDMVRCGLAIYGYGDERLKPVMSAETEVYNVIDVKKGERIGYSYSAPKDTKVAVLGVGYADSVRRRKQKFFIDGQICETVGNICMDMCMIDIGDLDVKKGDKAQFLGENMLGESVAERNETIIYEILTSFGSRCRRIYE